MGKVVSSGLVSSAYGVVFTYFFSICWLHTLINEIPGLELRMACQDFLTLVSQYVRVPFDQGMTLG
jgi:hypothetical protein